MTTEQQAQTRQRLCEDLARMNRWADNCPTNFRHLQYLMEAELAQLNQRDCAVLSLYDAAIETARQHGFLRDEAMANERAARYLLTYQNRRAAEGYLRAAYNLYDRWGARRKVVQLEQTFAVLHELAAGVASKHSLPTRSDLDLASIMKASREISGEMVLDTLLEKTMDILLENAGGQWGCLLVQHPCGLQVEVLRAPEPAMSAEHSAMELSIPSELPGHQILTAPSGQRVALPVGLISLVLHNSEALVLQEATQEALIAQDPYIRLVKPRSVLCVPIQRERLRGVLYMENNLSSHVFTQSRVEVIKLLVAQAAVAIDNARLYRQVQDYSRTLEQKVAQRTAQLEQLNAELQEQADRDGLTGVANRRRGDRFLSESWRDLADNLSAAHSVTEMEHTRAQPLSVVMLDVDHFKAFNDGYGHQQGDQCLIQVAQAVDAQLTSTGGVVARYGGEEFILILPDTDSHAAVLLAEQVRHTVQALAIPHAYASTAAVITVSMGVATAIPNQNAGYVELVEQADRALYAAKRAGRNQVQLFVDLRITE